MRLEKVIIRNERGQFHNVESKIAKAQIHYNEREEGHNVVGLTHHPVAEFLENRPDCPQGLKCSPLEGY